MTGTHQNIQKSTKTSTEALKIFTEITKTPAEPQYMYLEALKMQADITKMPIKDSETVAKFVKTRSDSYEQRPVLNS
jgi:hypothetical protein